MARRQVETQPQRQPERSPSRRPPWGDERKTAGVSHPGSPSPPDPDTLDPERTPRTRTRNSYQATNDPANPQTTHVHRWALSGPFQSAEGGKKSQAHFTDERHR